MAWLHEAGIVEQVQTIHRASQVPSVETIHVLVGALRSPYPLARRKASRGLFERGRMATDAEKQALNQSLPAVLNDADPIVEKNLIRTMASLNTPASRQSLQRFFKTSSKPLQLTAVSALLEAPTPTPSVLEIARSATPYPEVRQAITDRLR